MPRMKCKKGRPYWILNTRGHSLRKGMTIRTEGKTYTVTHTTGGAATIVPTALVSRTIKTLEKTVKISAPGRTSQISLHSEVEILTDIQR